MSAITELQITEPERKAILAALPLTAEVIVPNPVNAAIINMASGTAASKLQANKFLFSVAEIRAISIAITAAVLVCTGKYHGFIDSEASISEWKDKLVPHYFALNKLDPVLSHYTEVHLE